jgi:integrase
VPTAEMGAAEVTGFLNWLATERKVAAATQNQAVNALLFLYKHVLGKDLPWFEGLVRAKRPVRLPVVLSEADMSKLLAQLDGTTWLVTSLLYGAGPRLHEGLMLRVKDIDFAYRQIVVREGKGAKDRVTMLPPGTGATGPSGQGTRAAPDGPRGRLRRSLAATRAGA